MHWCTAALLKVIASKKVIAAGYSVSICQSNCGQWLLQFGILTGSRTVCLSAAYASTCLCSRLRSFSKKVVRAGTPILQPRRSCKHFWYISWLLYVLAWRNSLVLQVWQQFAKLRACSLCARSEARVCLLSELSLTVISEPLMVWWILESLNNFEPPGRIVCWEWCMGLWKAKHFCKAQLCTQKVQLVFLYEAEPARYAAPLLTQVPSMVSTRCRCPRCLM